VFPAAGATPKGPFAASPVLNGTADAEGSATRVYIGSTDGNLYALGPDDGVQDPDFHFSIASPITSTALLAQRFGADAVFFGAGDGDVYGIDSAGNPQVTDWPSPLGGFISSSPALNSSDGTVYVGGLSGFIAGVCPNGVARFASTTISVQSSPATGADGTLFFGGDDGLLRAVRTDGALLWTFSASGAILGAPAVAVANGATTAIYVADRGGNMFAVTNSGQPLGGFDFAVPVGPMASSPALAGNRLYVGSDDGNLYAVDATTGAIVWAFQTGAEIVSSPAVATGATQPIIVVGSNDGNVYFVADAGTSATATAVFSIGAPVRSSPAIGSDGTVYVGADDGRVYAIQ
jgi:outer membrane protein assembly factor BamB